jgi:hypothetical protein
VFWYLVVEGENTYIRGLIIPLFCFLCFFSYKVIFLSELKKYLEPTLLLSLSWPLPLSVSPTPSLHIFLPLPLFYISPNFTLNLTSISPLQSSYFIPLAYVLTCKYGSSSVPMQYSFRDPILKLSQRVYHYSQVLITSLKPSDSVTNTLSLTTIIVSYCKNYMNIENQSYYGL